MVEYNDVEPRQINPGEKITKVEPSQLEPDEKITKVEPSQLEPEEKITKVEPSQLEPEEKITKVEPRQIKPGEKITKKNIFMFQFVDHGYIKNIPGFKFSILNEGKTAFSKEESERPDHLKSDWFNTDNWFNRLYTHPTAKIEEVKL
jgi:hypothetical protein